MSAHDTCESCGGRVPPSAIKCPHCGSTDLRASARPAAAPAAAPTGAAPAARRVSRGPAVLVVLIVLFIVGGAVLAATGAVGFLAIRAPSGAASRPTPTATPAPARGGFTAVKARGKLRAAVDPDAPPFLSKSAAGGYEGYEYAVLAAIAGQRGVEFELVERDFTGLLPAVTSGEADLAIGQLAPTEASGIAWSVPYLRYELCLVVPVASAAKSLTDLRDGSLGLYDDPTTEAVITGALGASWHRRVYGDYGYYDDLVSGRLDGMVYDCPLARYELRGYDGKLKVANAALGGRQYAVAVSASDPALKSDVDAVLQELESAGLLKKIEQQWLDPARGAPH